MNYRNLFILSTGTILLQGLGRLTIRPSVVWRVFKIYLDEVPSFSLMYRPEVFHAVNESVWTGYPEKDDGNNIPPMDCTDGYGIAALYNLELVK